MAAAYACGHQFVILLSFEEDGSGLGLDSSAAKELGMEYISRKLNVNVKMDP